MNDIQDFKKAATNPFAEFAKSTREDEVIDDFSFEPIQDDAFDEEPFSKQPKAGPIDWVQEKP